LLCIEQNFMRMNAIFPIILLLTACLCQIALAANIGECKCWTRYEPRETNGVVQCHSQLTLLIVPCDIPQVPNCICKKAPVTSILTDKRGMWCSGSEEKWPCENVEEWNKYEKECKDERYCIPNSNKAD
ncbi:hypothetical protein AMK59_2427, partial [Oryctes borbonicus]